MGYEMHTWNTGEAITREKMNTIEKGIQDAYAAAEAAQETANNVASINNTQSNDISGLTNDINTLNAKLGGGVTSTAGETATDQFTSIKNTIGSGFDATNENNITRQFSDLRSKVNQNLGQAELAWQEMIGSFNGKPGMVEYDSTNNIVTTHLRKFLDDTFYTRQSAQEAYQTPSSVDTIPGDNNTQIRVASLADRITHIYNTITGVENKADANTSSITDLAETVSSIRNNIGQGAVTVGNRLDALDGGHISSDNDLPTRTIKELITEIGNAHFTNSDIYSTNSGESIDYGSLVARFNADESKIKNVETEINAAHRNGLLDDNDQAIADTLDLRFDHIDGGVKPIRTLPNVITEINGAHRDANDTLDARLDDIDDTTNADSIVSQVNTLKTSKIGTDKIFNDLTRAANIEGYVLDARQGKILRDIIGGTFDNINTVDARIDAIDNDTTGTVAVLAGRVSDLETEVDMDSANSRIDLVETEITDARTSSIITDEHTEEVGGETITTQVPHTYASVDARLEAIETHAVAARSDIDTIATELAMVDSVTHNIKDTNTKIDDLTADVAALASEINMGQDQNGRLTGAETRIDDIEAAIDHVHDENDPSDLLPDGLTQRLTAVETSITGENGINIHLNTIDNIISHEVSGNDVGGLTERLTAAESALATKANNSDLSSKANTTDVSLTVIKQKNEVTYITNANNETVPSGTQSWTIVERNDYLLQNSTDDKYYYWKYIGTASNGSWHLISGAGSGGSGNTSGMDVTRAQYTALASTTGYAENTDYYVTEESGLVHHYRYVTLNNTLTEIEIGPLVSNIKKYNISSGVQTVKVDGVDTDVTYLYLHEFAYGEDNDEPGQSTIITSIPLPAGGGAAISTQKMVRITERNIVQPLGAVTPVELKFFYTSGIENESGIGQLYIDDVAVGDEFTVTSGDPKNASSTWPTVTQENPLPKGFYSIDISQYCTELGTQQFRIKISDPDDTTGTMWKDLKWDVNVMNLTISSTFTEHSVNALNSTVKFIYTANGDIDKVANFKLGNTTLPSVNLSRNTSGIPQEYNISMPQAGVGAYKLEVWLTATANGHALPPSQSLYRDIIWYDSTSSDVIISSPYRGNVEEPVTQYDVVEIPYTIVGGTTPYTVYYYVDDMSTPIDQVTLSGNSGLWEYNANIKNVHTLKIECQSASITFSLNVAKLDTDIAPVTTGLILDFNPQGITNTSTKRLWTNDTYHMTVSNNFDWYNGGYGSDADGDYFLIKAGTRAIFDYKMFKAIEDNDHNILNEVFENGKEFKIIFKTNAVRNADAIWFTNMGASGSNENAKQVGIQLSTHNGFLKTNAASDIAVGSGDDEVAATNTYLYFSYSEEDKIELDININQKSETSQFIMSYEDGCPSKAYPYKTSEILYHFEDATHEASDIVIGSDDCDVYIYRMRIYDRELSTEQVLRNFIADGKNSTESIKRYNRNCIYYDTNDKVFVPYAGNNTVLDPVRLATKIPDIKVLMLETPQFTKSKKDFIPYSSLRCIHAPGGKVFPSRGKKDNWLFQNGYHAGQGTTSDKYGNAGRNLDFLFMCDGVHNPSDKVSVKKENFLPGYQSSLILGYGTDEQEAPKYCLDWKDEDTWRANNTYELTDNGHDTLVRYNGEVYKCIEAHTSTSEFDATKWELQEGYTSKITLKNDSIPNNFFNLKVNIASSENANNALLQKRYNDFLPYVSPAKARDNRIKNDMEFVPAIIFVRETGSAVVDGQTVTYERREFNDDQWHFYALGNIGDSKKTDYTRAYDPQDMNEFTLEISDNNTNNSQFQSGIYMASFYRPVAEPVIDDIADYYVAGNTIGTVEIAIPNSAETETQYYGNFTKTLDAEITQGTTYYTFIEKRRFVEPYTLEQDMDEGEPVEGSFTAMSAAGEGIQEVDYLFPIDYDTEWAAVDGEGRPINMRYWALFNEGFDGDHSFEMRYACKGDYRDGKVVNDTTGQAKAQLKINEKVWREFYTWLITSTDEQFVNELEQWCVKASVDFFYAFTHYYTMMDNRAKNTFWHFAKTGKHRRVTRPTKTMLHVYEEATGPVTRSIGDPNIFEGTFTPTSDVAVVAPYFVDEYTLVQSSKFSNGITYYTYNNNQYTIAEVTPGNDIPDNIAYYTHAYVLTDDTTIQENTTYYQLVNNVYTVATVTTGDSIKQYYTQYAFDMWVYDTDTALGIDNNGELVFPYGKEDTDYRIANDPSSSNVFNGAGSVFWRRLRDNCKDDIRSIFTSVRSECFNANTLIQEFDQWQECYPEAIWRLDVERKYIRSYTGDTGPNDVYKTRKETRFLRDMMQGRKRYQRRQWSKDQDIYFGSKYMLPSVSDDFFEFSCYNPGGMAVTPNWDLTITPYQDMYINISYAETFANPFRAKAGVTYEFKSILNTMNDSRIRVFGANHIQALAGKAKREDPNDPEKITGADGLASFYIKANNFENGKKLRKLILGTDNPNYQNGNFTTLNIANDYPILEEFSIKNCNNLGGQLDFSKSTALKVIDAQGTKITQVLLPGSTGIQTLHLPETTQAIELASARQLNELTVNNRQGTQDLSNLTRLNINDSDYSNNINWLNIAKLTLTHLDLLSILNMQTAKIGNIDELEPFKQKQLILGNRMSLSGRIKVIGNYSDIELQDYDNFWSHKITFDVSQGTKQNRWKITYKYDDYYNEDTEQTILGDTIKILYVADGEQVPDIWEYWDEEKQEVINILTAEDGWTNPPQRNSTRSTQYTFGTYTDNHYNEYSGWKYEDATSPINSAFSASGHITLYTYFKTTDRTYTINWYLKQQDNGDGTSSPIDLIKSSNNVKYGQGYDQSAPTVKDIHDAYSRSEIQNSTATITIEGNTATYEIFDGWQRLPTNINPDGSSNNFNIFAKWKTGQLTLSDGIIDNIQNISPEELAILSSLPLTANIGPSRQKCAPTLVASQTISYQMGHDYDTTISPIMNTQRGQNTPIWRFDRNDNPMNINSIMPFSAESTANGWTMAIDYSFAPDIDYDNPANSFYPNAAVLAGCYDVVEGENSNTIVGFALYENRNSDYGPIGPCLGFGDMFNQAGQVVSLGSSSTIGERDIVVIRKPKNSSSLFIYTGKNGNSTIQTTIAAPEKSWNKITTEAKLELGKLGHSSLSSLVTRAKGTIYWAKYWPEDLGAGECVELASWPHETITFGVANNMSNATSRNRLSPENTAITLTAISSSNYGVLAQDAAGKAYGDVTGWRTSLARTICNSRIFQGLPTTLQSIICKPSIGTKNLEIKKDGGGSNITVLTNIDAVRDYIYLPSVANYSSNSNYQQEGGLYPWVTSTAGITVYTYTVSGSQFISNSASPIYKNLRFPGQPISLSTLRILNIDGQADNFKNIFNGENSPYGSIASGDIVIENNQTAYMYVSSNDILTKGLQVEPDSGKFATEGNGGWLQAQEHWTRSINYNNSTNYYIYIDNETGAIQTSSPSSNGLHLNYSFSV